VTRRWSATGTTNTSLNESQLETTLRAVTRTPDAKTTVPDERVMSVLTSTLIEKYSRTVCPSGTHQRHAAVDVKCLMRSKSCNQSGIWRNLGNDPSVLLWIDIRDHVHFQTDVLTKSARRETMVDPHERLKRNMHVYRQSDLQSLQDDMEQFWRAAKQFNSYLRFSVRDPQLDQIRSILEIPLVKATLSP
jgi:hypothetical protein